MYLKISYFLLLVGLISQTIAAPNQRSELSCPNLVYDPVSNSYTPSIMHKCRISNYSYPTYFMALEKDVAQLSDGNDLSLDETLKQVEIMFDKIIEEVSTDKFMETVDRETERLTFLILSTKKSYIHEVIRTIASSSKKLMKVMPIVDSCYDSFAVMKSKIILSAMLKEDPLLSGYILNFTYNVWDVLDRYQESGNREMEIKTLTSILETTKQDIIDLEISKNVDIIELLWKTMDKLSMEMERIFLFETISATDQFRIVQCTIAGTTIRMFDRMFMFKFLSEIDPPTSKV